MKPEKNQRGCKNCRYHKRAKNKWIYFCINEESRRFGIDTDDSDCCEEWENKEF